MESRYDHSRSEWSTLRDLLEHVGEGEFEDVVGEAVGVFVLEPEAARVEEGTVVGAVGADEGWDDGDFGFLRCGVFLAAGYVEDFDGPAFLHVFKEVEAGALVVGEEEVEFAVGVDVDEAQAGVIAARTDSRR